MRCGVGTGRKLIRRSRRGKATRRSMTGQGMRGAERGKELERAGSERNE
jgi:hypothetical protein